MNRVTTGKKLDVKMSRLFNLFKNRRFLIIAGSVLLIALMGGIYSIVFLGNLSASDQSDNENPGSDNQYIVDTAEVLPQQIRNDGNENERSWSVFDPVTDPFGSPMRLTGVVIGGRSGSMAIIESGGTSYLVSEGDYVDDLWAVRQITRGMVILRAHNQEVSLYFDQPPAIRTLDYESESEEDASEEGV